jgi:inorganic pyrophosphatase
MSKHRLDHLPTWDRESGQLNVVIETPRNSRNKYDFDPHTAGFLLHSILPVGMSFPFDFGFAPSTLAADGDPLDVVLLTDEPVFPGCRVLSRLVGIIEARQRENKRTFRNDRLLAVACESRTHASIRSLDDIDARLLDELEGFFVAYNKEHGKVFKPLARGGPSVARKLIKRGMTQFKRHP